MGEVSRFSHKDTRLIGRALRERWPIPDNLKSEIVKGMIDVALHGDKDEHKIRAVNTLARLDSLNLEDRKQSLVLQETLVEYQVDQLSENELDNEINKLQKLLGNNNENNFNDNNNFNGGFLLEEAPTSFNFSDSEILTSLKEDRIEDYFKDPPVEGAEKNLPVIDMKGTSPFTKLITNRAGQQE